MQLVPRACSRASVRRYALRTRDWLDLIAIRGKQAGIRSLISSSVAFGASLEHSDLLYQIGYVR